jgi:NADH-quinone oxidoreductase subunit L
LITAVLTAIYMTRLMVMTFYGQERFHLALPEEAHADEAQSEHVAPLLPEEGWPKAAVVGAAGGQSADHQADWPPPDRGGSDQDHDDDEEHHALPPDFHPHESPISMTIPLIVLAILSTIGGLVGIPYAVSSVFGAGDINVFERTLEPVIVSVGHGAQHSSPALVAPGERTEATATEPATVEHATAEHASAAEISTERMLALLSVLLALAGIAIGWFVFNPKPLARLPQILVDKWRIDELYNGYIVDPLTDLSREGFWKGFDLGFIDGVVNGAGYFVLALGSVFRRVQVGFIRSYAAIILLGALVVVGYFIYFGFRLIS